MVKRLGGHLRWHNTFQSSFIAPTRLNLQPIYRESVLLHGSVQWLRTLRLVNKLRKNSNSVQELLYSLNQEFAIDELAEMQEQDIEELETLDSDYSEDRMTPGNLTEGLR
ncbi:hypothetical protein TNCV_2448221 [Trichonephila clavipes]|uniref:Uncharacterized protein n=1 Tax=Trichonephila clavipes TaxID=2585209 RepID=A0A8X6SI52_TRICX|nr:hypothetical protein TNCV_2448221 [Trichonephila clavipes]